MVNIVEEARLKAEQEEIERKKQEKIAEEEAAKKALEVGCRFRELIKVLS